MPTGQSVFTVCPPRQRQPLPPLATVTTMLGCPRLQPGSAAERHAVGALLMIGLVLRVVTAWRFRVDSDESQHLHVVWAWTRGMLPYRDVFDNHMPLFHLLTAPALLPIGERPTALLWMRLLMIAQ